MTDNDIFDHENIFEDDFLSSKMSLENELSKVTQLLQEKDFDSIEEVNEFLNNHLKGGSTPPRKNSSNKEQAQDLLYEAFEATGMKRKKLAEKALTLYPNSPDANNILAEFEEDPEELLVMGMRAGEQELGKKYFKENKGYFWGLIETRPYMRVKFNYASFLQDVGREEGAIFHYKELIELNPSDNQGVRFELFVAYVEEEMLEEAKGLLEEYNESHTTRDNFNRVLSNFYKMALRKR
ncbi:lipopolysaccharide assembly protein LapB [Alkalihalobacillus sp. BA299]|uniref:tetratricopeptide repeat protein n=1 Tax=Alkalihalobacillus sp. BA299 TaxID=2815938 RepID=UPI001ADC46C6|nr:hypothetical protein [Alkalihalobacillus sp. BA299]